MAVPPAEQLVEAVMAKLGYTQTQLANSLGLGAGGYQRVHGWIVGTKKLRYEDTWALLEAVGWIVPDEDAAIPKDPLAEVAAALVDLRKIQEREARAILRRLATIQETLDRPDEAGGARPRPNQA